MVYYGPQRSLGKVMFLHVSVILFTGGGLSFCLGGLCPGGSLSGGVSVQGDLCLGGSLSWRPPIRSRAGGTHPSGMHSCLLRNLSN